MTPTLFLLGHFWSLCVEEHFYLIWPLFAVALSARKLLFLCLALVGVGLISRSAVFLFGASDSSVWAWLTLQRIDGLAVGAMIAIGLRSPRFFRLFASGRRYNLAFALLAACCLALMWLPRRLAVAPIEVVSETLVVCFFGCVLLSALRLNPQSLGHRILASRTLMTFGKYSYGLYVIHGILRPWFARVFDMTALPQHGVLPVVYLVTYYLATIALSFTFAFLSFHLYEKPWLSLKRHFEYRS